MLFVTVLQSVITVLLNCFFFLKRLQTVTDFLFCHLFPHRREKLEEFLDSHCKLSPGTRTHLTMFPVCC